MPPRVLLLVVVITLVWGTNWSLFPVVMREVSVWTFRTVCVLVAGCALLAAARWRGLPLTIPRRYWPVMGISACCSLLLWNIASTYAAVMIPSGQAAVLGFTMPLWLALLNWAVFGERLGRRMQLALVLGALAVLLLAWRSLGAYAQAPLGVALALLAGLGWAVGTLTLKRGRVEVNPMVLSGWQLLLTLPPTAAGALWVAPAGPWHLAPPGTLLLMLYIALVPMAIGNAAWVAIIGLVPASVAGMSSVAVPVVAMVMGALVHGEPLGPVQWAAIACSALGLRLALVPAPAPVQAPGQTPTLVVVKPTTPAATGE